MFKDTSFPYSAVGRLLIEENGQSYICTATLVGPRHIITASHCAYWTGANIDDTKGPTAVMTFQPDFYDVEVFTPSSKVIWSYWYVKVVEGAASPNDGFEGGDFMIGILDRTVGLENGYFQMATYDTSWNGQEVWNHIGYPGATNGLRPVFQGPAQISEATDFTYGMIMSYEGDTMPGDSGGPIFTNFGDKPTLVGVVSRGAATGGETIIHGGYFMVTLLNKALEEWE